MLISVAIPTYKRLPFLKKAISDVMAQTYQNLELIVSDECWTLPKYRELLFIR